MNYLFLFILLYIIILSLLLLYIILYLYLYLFEFKNKADLVCILNVLRILFLPYFQYKNIILHKPD